MSGPETIRDGAHALALIVRSSFEPDVTTFLTSETDDLQLGFVVYPQGGVIAAHSHRPIERHIRGTKEVLLVKQGSCEVDIFSDERKLVGTATLEQGDVLVMLGGGHGFRMLEDTILLEVKQGPYTGVDEKERF